MESDLGPFEACNGGDWSPRISFSHSFGMMIDRISRPNENPIQDLEFEFSSFVGTDLPFEQRMLSADELFCDGKLRPLEKRSGNGQSSGKAGESKAPQRMGRSEEMGGKAGEGRSPTNREELVHVGRSAEKGGKGGEWGAAPAPTRMRELLAVKRSEEDEEVVQMRRFSKNPRCVSMTVEGSYRLANRNCISLNNSRCPSPSRSFSLPSTTPASPTSTSSFSAFSSSSSSKYSSRIRDFFKLKKLHPTDISSSSESSLSSSCRLPISPRSFWPFSKSKESTNSSLNSSNSNVTMDGCVASKDGCSACRDGCSASRDGSTASKDLPPLSRCQVSPKSKDSRHSCLPPVNCAKSPSQPTSPIHFTPSSPSKTAASISRINRTKRKSTDHAVGSRSHITHSHTLPHAKACNGDGPTVIVIDERVWDYGSPSKGNYTNSPGKQGIQRVKNLERGNMMMVGSRGIVRPKGLERPIAAYTSSVRVTPVLNVPGCITPSLRKTKSSSKPKAFSFGSLFAKREKIPMASYTLIPPTHDPSGG